MSIEPSQNGGPAWRPPRQGLAAQWWLQLILKYLVGGGGLVWETVIDHLRNPTAFIVFGGIAGLTDVLGYAADVRAQAKRDIERVHEQEPEHEQEHEQ